MPIPPKTLSTVFRAAGENSICSLDHSNGNAGIERSEISLECGDDGGVGVEVNVVESVPDCSAERDLELDGVRLLDRVGIADVADVTKPVVVGVVDASPCSGELSGGEKTVAVTYTVSCKGSRIRP